MKIDVQIMFSNSQADSFNGEITLKITNLNFIKKANYDSLYWCLTATYSQDKTGA